MALSRFCEPFLFSRTRKTVRSLKKKRSEIIGARRSSCSRHFQGAFLGGGYPGLKPCMCTARYRVLPRSSSSSSSFSTSLDARNAPIANYVQRSRTRTRTRTIGEVPILRCTHTKPWASEVGGCASRSRPPFLATGFLWLILAGACNGG